jgi:hypothetical protein
VTGQSLGAQVTAGFTVPVFGYDAARVPWRIGLDACGGNATSRDLVNSIVQYFAGSTTKVPHRSSEGRLVKSTQPRRVRRRAPVAKDFQGSFIGPMGVGAMGATVTRPPRCATGPSAPCSTCSRARIQHHQLPSTVGFITLLIMSGNFPAPLASARRASASAR